MDLTESELRWLASDDFAHRVSMLDAECVGALVEHYRRTRLDERDREALRYLASSVPAAGAVAEDAMRLIARLLGGRG